MNNQYNNPEVVSLSFSLTRVQRLFNPLAVLITFGVYILICIGAISFFVFAVVAAFSPAAWLATIWIGLLTVAAFFIVCFVLRLPMLEALRSLLVNDRYYNHIEITDSHLKCGIDRLSINLPRNKCRVTRGIFSSNIVSCDDLYLVVPESVISLADLTSQLGK